MKIFDIVLEEKQAVYAIGDTHALEIGKAGGFIKYAASNRSAFSAENESAVEEVKPGSVVVLSAGTYDMNNQNKTSVIQRVEKLLFTLVEKKNCTVFFVIPAATDAPAFIGYKDLLRNELLKQIPDDFPAVKLLDIGKLSIASGSDGVTAPGPWYQQVSRIVAGSAKETAPQSGKQATIKGGDSDAGPGQSTSDFAKNDPRRTDKEKSDAEGGQSTSKFADNDPRRTDRQPPTFEVPAGRYGPAVKKLQMALMALGYPVGPDKDDGKFGKNTRAAVLKFQKNHGLKETGTFDSETVNAISAEIAKEHKNQTGSGGTTSPSATPAPSTGAQNTPKPQPSRSPGQSGKGPAASNKPTTPGTKKFPKGATAEQIERYGERIETPVDEHEMMAYVEQKLSRNHAIAMVINARHESYRQPGRWVASDNGQGPSGGLFMFHDGNFKGIGFFSDMVRALGGPGKWQYDWKGQIDFALSYPKGQGPKFAKRHFSTAEAATYWFCYNFESPANKKAVSADRAKEAHRYNTR